MDIKVLGPGCKKCKELEKAVQKAVEEIGLDATVEKVEDMDKITEYNVLMTPGLVINGKVKVFGRVPKHKDIIRYIQEEM
ncbi:TM0996/MTH895 family glutaredoxin-like protein [Desulfallas sp. Bu1-1]|uniref:thioredoxin family protein n=1 Tax=Desulfallas sp. Bu1-1 TaxID=2787620 RepID=UPI00189F1766|nr:thioredoxin family protein [Desulfallas sp. Bu1-1]MBF7084278.1 TM0996/MTH895 family glutaredoxin-like protein [Desulfallas sp. Bu1-1]